MVWLIILAASFSVSRIVLGLMRGKRQRGATTSADATRPLVCPNCKYNLSGITSVLCPECGAILPPDKPAARNEVQEKRLAAARAKVAEAYAKRRGG